MTSLHARFAVDGWEGLEIESLAAGNWLETVEMRKTFTSGLVGTSVALFASSGEVEGQRCYFAAERITAGLTPGGEQGSLTVYHGGLESSPDSWFGHVVPHTGTGPFSGWSGSAQIIHDEEGPYFSFEVP